MANIYDMADTWNEGSTVFAAIKMDVTDTASAAGSALLDLLVGGAKKFEVTKAGAVQVYNAYTDASNYERAYMRWDTNRLNIGTEAAGTGTVRSLQVSAGATSPGGIVCDTGSVVVGPLLQFTQGNGGVGTVAAQLYPIDTSVLRVTGGGSVGAAIQLNEMASAPAAASNAVRLYVEDDGGGKTRLMARFGTGAAQQIAIEP